MGDTPRLFAVLRGLAAFYQQRGELHTANALAEQLVDLARRAQDPALLLRGYQTHGSTLFYRGELALARRLLEQGMTGYQPQSHRSQAWRSGLNTSVICLGHMAWNLWLLGYPEQALKKSGEALTLAQELAHPHSLAYASHFLCVIHQFRRQVHLTQERAEVVFSLSVEYGLAFWRAYGTVMRGWASALQGQGEAGIPLILQGLAALRETGGELGRTYFLALLAEAYGKMGRLREGLDALTEALAAVHKATEHFYEAELYRLKGEVLLAQIGAEQRAQSIEERLAEVEACFQQALTVAHRQQARSLELRAAISLARLWQQQGKHQTAHHLLAEIYAWFEQGFNTADLQEARALLMALA
jgi:predicted ATPase